MGEGPVICKNLQHLVPDSCVVISRTAAEKCFVRKEVDVAGPPPSLGGFTLGVIATLIVCALLGRLRPAR